MFKKISLGLMMVSAALFAPAQAATPDNWPERNITVVVPYPPGGSADILGRLVAKVITDATGTTAIVENISGGATIPGARAVLREPNDGHTFFMASDNTLNVNHYLFEELPYAKDDFVPVTVLNNYPHWLIVKNDDRFPDFEAFKQYIADHPGEVSISINTIGGAAHLALEKWRQDNDFDFEIIPYRGSPPAVQDLIAGVTDAHIDVAGSSISHARNKAVNPLAVLQDTPLDEFPNAATQSFDNEGDFVIRSNLSIVAKKGTPDEILAKVYEIVKEGATTEEFINTLNTLAYDAILMEPAQAKEFLQSETERYRELVELSGLEKQ